MLEQGVIKPGSCSGRALQGSKSPTEFYSPFYLISEYSDLYNFYIVCVSGKFGGFVWVLMFVSFCLFFFFFLLFFCNTNSLSK